jgi:hypothetical protein
VNNFNYDKHICPETGIYDLYLYTYKYEDPISANMICLLEETLEINYEDRELSPDFIVKNKLSFLYSGENFEAVTSSAYSYKKHPSMNEIISGLNHYREYDDFLKL